MLECPLDNEIGAAGKEENSGAEDDSVAFLGLDRRVEIPHVHRYARTRDAADGVELILVDRPQPRPENLVRDRIDVLGELAVELEPWCDVEVIRRQVPVAQRCPASAVLTLVHA